MYDYGFSVTESRDVSFDCSGLRIKTAGGTVGEISVELENIPSYTIVNGAEPEITSETLISDFVYAPVEKGKNVGKVNFYADGKLMCTVNMQLFPVHSNNIFNGSSVADMGGSAVDRDLALLY